MCDRMVFHWLRMEEEEMLVLNESSSEEMRVRMEELSLSSLSGEGVTRISGWEERVVSRDEGEGRFLDCEGGLGV